LDLVAIRRTQRANDVSILKRERESRDARQALTAARAAEAEARRASEGADAALYAARREHLSAVAACHGVDAGDASMAPGALLLRFRYCECAAHAVTERLADREHALQAWHHAQTQVEERSREFTRAEQRLEQARKQREQWRQRERQAIELHADLALEDEPRRSK
jgi:hypothetical protein